MTDEHLPDFLERPARFARSLSSDAQRAVIDGMSGGVGSSGLPYFANATAALGWYQNHFTDLGILARRIQALDTGAPAERYREVRATVVAAREHGGVDAHRELGLVARREEPLKHVYTAGPGVAGHDAHAFTGEIAERHLAVELFVALNAKSMGGADKARPWFAEYEPELSHLLGQVTELVERVHRSRPEEAFAEGLKTAFDHIAQHGVPGEGWSSRFHYASPTGTQHTIILTRADGRWVVEHGVPF